MDAVILAAGIGQRLRPHTLITPKPLLPVQGRPILDWTLAALPQGRGGITRLVVVTHHLAEQVDQYLESQSHVGEWVTVRQETPRGTGDALRACRGLIHGDRFLVLNGDDLYGAADLAALAEVSAGLLAHPVTEPRKFGIVFPRTDGTLDRLIEKPDLDGVQLANIGAYVFPASAVDIDTPLSPRGEYEITDVVSAVADRQPVHVVRAGFWLPIGTPDAWAAADRTNLSRVLSAERRQDQSV